MNEQMKEYAKELNIDKIHDTVAQMIELVGIENALKIVATFGGTEVYIPKIERQLIHVRNARMKKEYNGKNLKQLCMKYSLTENRVRKIIFTAKC